MPSQCSSPQRSWSTGVCLCTFSTTPRMRCAVKSNDACMRNGQPFETTKVSTSASFSSMIGGWGEGSLGELVEWPHAHHEDFPQPHPREIALPRLKIALPSQHFLYSLSHPRPCEITLDF